VKVLKNDQISTFWGKLCVSYNAVNMAGEFSNSKLAHAANFEAPFIGAVQRMTVKLQIFPNTSSPDRSQGRGTDS